MIVPRHYEDLSVLHENVLPARAYYIPASKRMDDLIEHREESDRMQVLNGNWRFRYFESIYDVKEAFYEVGFDVSDFDEILVRGCGRRQDTTHISIRISAIRFRLIHRMFRRISPAGHMSTALHTTRTRMRQRLI